MPPRNNFGRPQPPARSRMPAQDHRAPAATLPPQSRNSEHYQSAANRNSSQNPTETPEKTPAWTTAEMQKSASNAHNKTQRQEQLADNTGQITRPDKQSPRRLFNPSINGSTRCVNSTPASSQKHFQSHSRKNLTAPDTDPEDQTGYNGNTTQLRNDRTPDTAGKIGHEVRSRPAILPPYRNFNPLRCRNPTQPECCPSYQTICPKGSERCVP